MRARRYHRASCRPRSASTSSRSRRPAFCSCSAAWPSGAGRMARASVDTQTGSAAETEAVAAALAADLRPGDVVLVSGELGAGKTTFVRGACRALGVRVPVTSPTFTIARRYEDGRVPVSHLDLFRLAEGLAEEEPELLDDELGPDRVAFVEWPEVAGDGLPGVDAAARVRLAHTWRRPPPGRLRAITPTLGFDTATPDTVVALTTDGAEPLELRHAPAPGERPGHAAQPLPPGNAALDRAGLAFEHVERLGVGVGPGTFTGLRIGVATARALAQGSGADTVPVSTLRALAAASGHDGPVLAVLDARRCEAFAAAYRGGAGLVAPDAVKPERLASLVAGGPDGWLAVGDGAVKFRH